MRGQWPSPNCYKNEAAAGTPITGQHAILERAARDSPASRTLMAILHTAFGSKSYDPSTIDILQTACPVLIRYTNVQTRLTAHAARYAPYHAATPSGSDAAVDLSSSAARLEVVAGVDGSPRPSPPAPASTPP